MKCKINYDKIILSPFNGMNDKSFSTVFMFTANKDWTRVSIYGELGVIRRTMVTVMVDNPKLIKAIDGACREARAIIKERQEDEELHASG